MFEIARNSSGLLDGRKPVSTEAEARDLARALANRDGEAFQVWDDTKMLDVISPDDPAGLFRIRNFGNDLDYADIGALKLALRAYVGKSVTVEDLRAGGKIHHFDINEWGINESYGSRLVVNDLALLLEVPGHPVYA